MKLRLFAAGVLALAVFSSPPVRADALDRVVASIDGEPVTLYELEQFEAKERAAPMPNGEVLSRQQLLQALITDRLVAKEIATKGIRVRDEDIDHYIDRIKDQNHLND